MPDGLIGLDGAITVEYVRRLSPESRLIMRDWSDRPPPDSDRVASP